MPDCICVTSCHFRFLVSHLSVLSSLFPPQPTTDTSPLSRQHPLAAGPPCRIEGCVSACTRHTLHGVQTWRPHLMACAAISSACFARAMNSLSGTKRCPPNARFVARLLFWADAANGSTLRTNMALNARQWHQYDMMHRAIWQHLCKRAASLLLLSATRGIDNLRPAKE